MIVVSVGCAMRNDRPKTVTMRCVGCGHALDGIRSRECPECAHPFDPSDPGSYTRSLERPRRLLIAGSLAEAESIVDLLEMRGVPAALEDNAPGIIEQAKASVWVNAWDTERVLIILRHHRSAHASSGEGWTCPSCSEHIEPQFGECWNCRTPRPHTA